MAITKQTVDLAFETAVETVKNIFNNIVNPNMTIEDIADVASLRLDDVIKKNEARGLEYSAGKFRVKFVDDAHFRLEFEMYFRDADGKWHKLANESDPRDLKLLEVGAQKTIKILQTVEFPIKAPNAETQPTVDTPAPAEDTAPPAETQPTIEELPPATTETTTTAETTTAETAPAEDKPIEENLVEGTFVEDTSPVKPDSGGVNLKK